jgi:hypothetical protein
VKIKNEPVAADVVVKWVSDTVILLGGVSTGIVCHRKSGRRTAGKFHPNGKPSS